LGPADAVQRYRELDLSTHRARPPAFRFGGGSGGAGAGGGGAADLSAAVDALQAGLSKHLRPAPPPAPAPLVQSSRARTAWATRHNRHRLPYCDVRAVFGECGSIGHDGCGPVVATKVPADTMSARTMPQGAFWHVRAT